VTMATLPSSENSEPMDRPLSFSGVSCTKALELSKLQVNAEPWIPLSNSTSTPWPPLLGEDTRRLGTPQTPAAFRCTIITPASGECQVADLTWIVWPQHGDWDCLRSRFQPLDPPKPSAGTSPCPLFCHSREGGNIQEGIPRHSLSVVAGTACCAPTATTKSPSAPLC